MNQQAADQAKERVLESWDKAQRLPGDCGGEVSEAQGVPGDLDGVSTVTWISAAGVRPMAAGMALAAIAFTAGAIAGFAFGRRTR